MNRLKAWMDLLRIHFVPAWILIFTAGYMTAVKIYGGFEWLDLIRVVLIAVLGFEAGMVLNDYVDRDLDKKDVDKSLSRYFRLFGSRPVAQGSIKSSEALTTFLVLAFGAGGLILTLPSPNRYFVLGIMIYSYLVEYFYQVKKRNQSFAWAQLIGRTDFSLFPVAGYLSLGQLDWNCLWYFLYFYPLAEAHLAVNDLADWENDKARKLASVPQLWGVRGSLGWIGIFVLAHLFTGSWFVSRVNPEAWIGFAISYVLLIAATGYIFAKKTSKSALRVLPLFHLAMATQALSLIF